MRGVRETGDWRRGEVMETGDEGSDGDWRLETRGVMEAGDEGSEQSTQSKRIRVK